MILKCKIMKISRQKDENNPSYLGYDEDHDKVLIINARVVMHRN